MAKKNLIASLAVAAMLAVTSVIAAPAQLFNPKHYPELGLKLTPIEALTWRVFGPVLRWIFAPFKDRALGSFASMLDTAYQTQYRDEFIAAFEARSSLLRDTVTTETVIKGNQAVFLVVGSGGETAKTRGANGMIPARNDDNNQSTVVLGEWHDLVRKTGFNIFASQGNQRQIMQMTSMGVINRKIDDQIITVLNTATVTVGGAGATPTLSLVQNARVKLSNASVPWDSYITLLAQPSLLAFLEQAPEFSSADYVSTRPWAGQGENPSWRDQPMGYRWRNMLIIEHPNLPGKGTASEKSFLYHRSAVGHAVAVGGISTAVGYNEEQDYTYARTSAFMGALLLQNAGVVVITTDGTVYG